jgi:hypothetical protein
MIKIYNKVLWVLIVFVVTSGLLYSRMFFVATNGNDENNGSEGFSWKTFEFAMSQLKAGDTLVIRGGIYHEGIVTQSDGTDNGPGAIVIIPYIGEIVVLSGNNYQGTGISISNSYIRFEHINLEFWDNAIDISAPASNIVLYECNAYDMNYGISVYGGTSNITLEKCEMTRFGHYGFDATAGEGTGKDVEISDIKLLDCYSHNPDFNTPNHNPDGNADGFAFGHNIERNILLMNCIADHTGDGFDLDGVNVTAINCIARNTTYVSGGGFKCWADTVILYNCLSYNNTMTGIEMARPGENPSYAYLIHCSLVDNGENNLRTEGNATHLRVYNSLIVGGKRFNDDVTPRGLGFLDVPLPEQYQGDYNIFHSITEDSYISGCSLDDGYIGVNDLAEWQNGTGQDFHSYFYQNIDTLFVDRENKDFHLRKGVGAIDKGTATTSYATDIEGSLRDSKPDIGCYEYDWDVGFAEIDDNSIFKCIINPSTKLLNVFFALLESDNISVSVYDINGRCMIESVQSVFYGLGGHILEVDCSKLAPGMYLVTMKGSLGTKYNKILIE